MKGIVSILAVSPWPEWLAIATVLVAMVAGRRLRARSLVAVAVVVAAAWLAGSAKALLVPLAVVPPLLGWARIAAGWGKYFCWGLAVTGLLCAAVLDWLFPLPTAPDLTGSHQVGTASLELPAEGRVPRLVVQVWYPAQVTAAAQRADWLPDRRLAPGFPFHRIARAKARAVHDAPLACTGGPRLPVVFYEHSWNGHRAENVVQVEDLASHGFIVVAVDHPGQAARIRFADGSVTLSSRAPMPDLSSVEAVARFKAEAEICFGERIRNLARVRAALADGALPAIAGKASLERVGVFGFSFGGSMAIRLCASEPGFHAGADEDGLFLGTAVPAGPFLFLDQQTPAWLLEPRHPAEDALQDLIRCAEERLGQAMTNPGTSRVILDGASHHSFSDRLYTCRIPRLAGAGRRPAAEIRAGIINPLVRFFVSAMGSG